MSFTLWSSGRNPPAKISATLTDQNHWECEGGRNAFSKPGFQSRIKIEKTEISGFVLFRAVRIGGGDHVKRGR
jgi:hypothetical protein